MRARATAAPQAASIHTAHAAIRRATSARDGLLALKLERGQVRQKHEGGTGKDTAPCPSNAGLQLAQPQKMYSSSSSVHAVGGLARSNLWLRSPSSAIATIYDERLYRAVKKRKSKDKSSRRVINERTAAGRVLDFSECNAPLWRPFQSKEGSVCTAGQGCVQVREDVRGCSGKTTGRSAR